MDYYSLLYLQGAQADPYLGERGSHVDVEGFIQRLRGEAPDPDGMREWGGVRLRDGDWAVRQGEFILIWNLHEWDVRLLRVES